LGRVGRGINCNVSGCANQAIRSISTDKAGRAGLNISGSRRAYLCRVHYKEMKKKLKKETMLEKWRQSA
jgi:hypothetical protein